MWKTTSAQGSTSVSAEKQVFKHIPYASFQELLPSQLLNQCYLIFILHYCDDFFCSQVDTVSDIT